MAAFSRPHRDSWRFLRNVALAVLVALAALAPAPARGQNTFPARFMANETIGNPGLPAIADLDGDGELDLRVPSAGTNEVGVLRGRGDGRFHAGVGFATRPGPVAVALGDVDGDGDLDLAIANRGDNSASILLG